MNINLKKLHGNWDDGYALDKHMLSSIFIGYNEQGHPQFDNRRSEAGEAVFQLKYRQQWGNSELLAQAVLENIVPHFPQIDLIVPMPASQVRLRQPVDDVATVLARRMNVPFFSNIVVRAPSVTGIRLKDLATKEEKDAELAGKFSIHDGIAGIDIGKGNALLIDDLFDSGASMQAVTATLKAFDRIAGVYVAALTWK
jgi:predicted amidophosphoribosyltransferase